MSETKFTKRRMLWLNSATGEQFIVDADDPTQVVSRYPSVYDATERDRANADLDLAAPDLYAALDDILGLAHEREEFYAMFKDYSPDGVGGKWIDYRLRMDAAISALAKARGEVGK